MFPIVSIACLMTLQDLVVEYLSLVVEYLSLVVEYPLVVHVSNRVNLLPNDAAKTSNTHKHTLSHSHTHTHTNTHMHARTHTHKKGKSFVLIFACVYSFIYSCMHMFTGVCRTDVYSDRC